VDLALSAQKPAAIVPPSGGRGLNRVAFGREDKGSF
jgi:hypothetical protein